MHQHLSPPRGEVLVWNRSSWLAVVRTNQGRRRPLPWRWRDLREVLEAGGHVGGSVEPVDAECRTSNQPQEQRRYDNHSCHSHHFRSGDFRLFVGFDEVNSITDNTLMSTMTYFSHTLTM